MARWRAEVRIALRPGIADPEGSTVADALRALGYAGVGDVRFGKLIALELDAPTAEAADEAVGEMCHRLLANPVMEVASWQVEPLAEIVL